jgi:hypothetical protein
MKMPKILQKFTAAAAISIAFSTTVIAQITSDKNDYTNRGHEQGSCNIQNDFQSFDLFLSDPNGVCEEKIPAPAQECPPIPVADISSRKDPGQLLEMLNENREHFSIMLEDVWTREYLDGSHASIVDKSLYRSLRTGELRDAVKGFREGLDGRERTKGHVLSDDERNDFLMLVFLPIVESNWTYEFSEKMAFGPYQFTRETAKKYGLVRELRNEQGKLVGMIDRRHKNYDSARAAAQSLYDLYMIFGGDIDLTLSAYNSGRPLSYLYLARKSGLGISYEGYLDFLAKKMEGTSPKSEKMLNMVENLNFPRKVSAALSIIADDYPDFAEFARGKLSYRQLQLKAQAISSLQMPEQLGRHSLDLSKIRDIELRRGSPSRCPRKRLNYIRKV